GRGGAETLLVGSIPYLDRNRYEVEVAYLLRGNEALAPAISATGALVHCLDAPQTVDMAWLGRLPRLVKAGGFDVSQTHAPPLARCWGSHPTSRSSEPSAA